MNWPLGRCSLKVATSLCCFLLSSSCVSYKFVCRQEGKGNSFTKSYSQPTDRPTNIQKTRLLELFRAAKRHKLDIRSNLPSKSFPE